MKQILLSILMLGTISIHAQLPVSKVNANTPSGKPVIRAEGSGITPTEVATAPATLLNGNAPIVVCAECDQIKIKIKPANNVVVNGNNTLTFNQPISITAAPPKLVKSIKAELVYFEFAPESEDCLPCNKDSRTFGNFDNGVLANVAGSGNGTHSLVWNFAPPKDFSGGGNSAAITITVPPTVKCCDVTVRWCIRYVITFEDCLVCTTLVCYELKGTLKETPFLTTKNNQP